MKNNAKFKEKLKKLNACDSAIEWVGDRTALKAWNECQNGSWMLWLIDKSNKKITLNQRKKLVLCACEIAETVLKYLPKNEKRPAEALRLASAWARGEKVSLDDVKTAAYAAYAANAAANAAAYAAYAANAAANAAAYAAANAAANAAAYAAAYAAYAAANAAYVAYAANAANAAYAAANAAAYAAYAAYVNIVRKYFPKPPKI